MKLLDLTLGSIFANVALDEALLEVAGQSESSDDVLRLWAPKHAAVVVGRSSAVDDEVHLDYCRANGIPIVRRCSGGAAIVTGPGCLMYAVVLSLSRYPDLELLDVAHRTILQRNGDAFRAIGIDVRQQGTSDLAVSGRKISGNSMRKTRDSVLYHGTFLYGMPSALIQDCLKRAPRQPEYRAGRDHADFVTNAPCQPDALRRALTSAWNASEILANWPAARTKQLVAEKYGTESWNLGR